MHIYDGGAFLFFIHMLTETSKCLFSEKLTLSWAFEANEKWKWKYYVYKLIRPSTLLGCFERAATIALHNFIPLKFISWLRWLTYWHRIFHMFRYHRNVSFAKTGLTGTTTLCCTMFAVNKIPCEQLRKKKVISVQYVHRCCTVIILDFTRTFFSMITVAKVRVFENGTFEYLPKITRCQNIWFHFFALAGISFACTAKPQQYTRMLLYVRHWMKRNDASTMWLNEHFLLLFVQHLDVDMQKKCSFIFMSRRVVQSSIYTRTVVNEWMNKIQCQSVRFQEEKKKMSTQQWGKQTISDLFFRLGTKN